MAVMCIILYLCFKHEVFNIFEEYIFRVHYFVLILFILSLFTFNMRKLNLKNGGFFLKLKIIEHKQFFGLKMRTQEAG